MSTSVFLLILEANFNTFLIFFFILLVSLGLISSKINCLKMKQVFKANHGIVPQRQFAPFFIDFSQMYKFSSDSSSMIIFCSGGLPTFCMVRVVKLWQKLWQRCSIKDSSHSPTSFAWQTSLWCFGTEKSLLGSKMFTHRQEIQKSN